MSTIEISKPMKNQIEKFRKLMCDYFSDNPEIFEDTATESEERLIWDALNYAIWYFEEQEKEINQG